MLSRPSCRLHITRPNRFHRFLKAKIQVQVNSREPACGAGQPADAVPLGGYGGEFSRLARDVAGPTARQRPPPMDLTSTNRRYSYLKHYSKAIGPLDSLSPLPGDRSSVEMHKQGKRRSVIVATDNPNPRLATVQGSFDIPPASDGCEIYSLDHIDHDADETLVGEGFQLSPKGLPNSPPPHLYSGYTSSLYSDAGPARPHQSQARHEPEHGYDKDDEPVSPSTAPKGIQRVSTHSTYSNYNDMEDYAIKDMYHATVGQIAASTRGSTSSTAAQAPSPSPSSKRTSWAHVQSQSIGHRRPASVQSNSTFGGASGQTFGRPGRPVAPVLTSTFEEDEDVRPGYMSRLLRRRSVVYEKSPAWTPAPAPETTAPMFAPALPNLVPSRPPPSTPTSGSTGTATPTATAPRAGTDAAAASTKPKKRVSKFGAGLQGLVAQAKKGAEMLTKSERRKLGLRHKIRVLPE
ncbi:unnamed protein product [Parascedosporium putredinis]|uniref:Uncharacterized protein n=1 Tax=Parascedosporium putredinis TaxID=1442378 RepID=A0A9P1H5S3_9PEZI|nr:unnamed protein product [Parascedosporium putredinis]CAI7998040.1 unnamed protein product [Parascedosporium putredinis]